MATVSIAIVDDQLLFRQGLAALISNVSNFKLLLEAETGSDLLEQLQKKDQFPDILLMDMKLPDMNGIELNEILHSKYPLIKLLLFQCITKSGLSTE